MKLDEYARQEGLSDEQIAEQIGDCSASGVRKWRDGDRIPRKDQMERIATWSGNKVRPDDFYDVPPLTTERFDQVFCGDDSEKAAAE